MSIVSGQQQQVRNEVGRSGGPTVQVGAVHGGLHLCQEQDDSRLVFLLVVLALVCVVLGRRTNA